MNSLNSVSPALSRRPATVFLKGWLPLAVGGLLLSLPPLASANPCSYGDQFLFTGTGGTGTMTDIDREVVTATVTNFPAQSGFGWALGTAGSFDDASNNRFSPSRTTGNGIQLGWAPTGFLNDFTTTATPASAAVPMHIHFSKSMRNLVANFGGGLVAGRQKVYRFVDGSGNPIPFTLRTTSLNGLPLTPSGTGTEKFFQQVATNILQASGGEGSIGFVNPVQDLYIYMDRPDGAGPVVDAPGSTDQTAIVAASGGGGVSGKKESSVPPGTHYIGFGQYCDEYGVLGPCYDPRLTSWVTTSLAPSNNVNAEAIGRVIDETGKVIQVNFIGGLAGVTGGVPSTVQVAGSGDQYGNGQMPRFNAVPLLQTSVPNTTTTTPVILKWKFSEVVHNPTLYWNESTIPGTYSFFRQDGVTPLPFVLRAPVDPDRSRQVDSNVFVSTLSNSALYTFTQDTDWIVMKVNLANAGNTTFNGQSTIYFGCSGMSTGSGNTLSGDADGDGVPDLADKCPNTPVGSVVGSDGCPLPTDLSIVKTASVTSITPGVAFDYVITVTNTGSEAQNVKASDIVPAGLTINTKVASNSGTVSQNGQTVQAVWPIVPAGGVRTLTINVTKP